MSRLLEAGEGELDGAAEVAEEVTGAVGATLARACAELEAACGQRILALEGRFRAPAPLGSDLVLGADLAAGSFAVGGAGRVVAEGRFQTG